MKLSLIFVLITLSAGCALMPEKKTEQLAMNTTEKIASNTSSDTTKGLVAPSIPNITNYGDGTVSVTVPPLQSNVKGVSATNQSAGSEDNTQWSFSKSIPFGVTLILIGIGVLSIVFAIKYALNAAKGTAAGAAIAVGDEALKSMINKWREQAANSTDHSQISMLMTNVASAQAERVKLAGTGNGK